MKIKNIFTYKILIVSILLLSQCQKENQSIVGIYESLEPSWGDKIQFKTSHYINGSKLALSKDSTYLYKTCGMLIYGTWRKKGDSLQLKVKQYKFFLDSLNRIKKELPPDKFFSYKIEGNSLLSYMPMIDYPGEAVINKLKKE